MATKAQEIDTVGDLLAPINPARFYKENFPIQYVANSIGIRWQGDSSAGVTGAAFKMRNKYQIIYFGASRVDCLNKADAISAIINDQIDMKTKIRGIDDYMTLMSFSMSPVFKTETDGVYAVTAILEVESNRDRTRPSYEKMGEINAAFNEGGN